jgi:hypothetical protein
VSNAIVVGAIRVVLFTGWFSEERGNGGVGIMTQAAKYVKNVACLIG